MNQDTLPPLPGIDLERGLKTVQNNIGLYKRLLGKFLESWQSYEQDFAQAQADADSAAPANSAHTLKGVAANLGMEDLRQAAYALELACKEGADDIEAKLQEVLAQLQIVLDGLKTL